MSFAAATLKQPLISSLGMSREYSKIFYVLAENMIIFISKMFTVFYGLLFLQYTYNDFNENMFNIFLSVALLY